MCAQASGCIRGYSPLMQCHAMGEYRAPEQCIRRLSDGRLTDRFIPEHKGLGSFCVMCREVFSSTAFIAHFESLQEKKQDKKYSGRTPESPYSQQHWRYRAARGFAQAVPLGGFSNQPRCLLTCATSMFSAAGSSNNEGDPDIAALLGR